MPYFRLTCEDDIDLPASLSLSDKVSEIHPPSGSMLSSWTVMSKTMIGTGMLGLAFATKEAGWVLGLTFLAVAGKTRKLYRYSSCGKKVVLGLMFSSGTHV